MRLRRRLAALAMLALCPGLADAQEQTADVPWNRTVTLDQGFSLVAPEGWKLEDAGDDEGDATGRRRVHLVCRTPACKRTQETCTLLLRAEPVAGADDAARLAGLYAEPLARYFRLRAVLKSTSAGASLRSPLQTLRIGERDWTAVETDAKHNKKSGLFAETVIGGRYLGAICRTCETGAIRHRDARALLASIRRRE